MLQIFRNIEALYSFADFREKKGRFAKAEDLKAINSAALVCDKGRIIWLGEQKKLPKNLAKLKSREFDLSKRIVLPGFVECHTHLVFAGNRAAEFEMKNQGASYKEIAAKGGGILSTMRETRKASASDLLASGQKRVDNFSKQGVTTLEVKTGYALDQKNEIKCLETISKLTGPRIVPTFLGAHARPPEFLDNESYLEFLVEKVLPAVAKKGLSKRIDIFYESGFFHGESSKKYLQKCQELGFQLILHSDQLSDGGGTQLGVDLGALSVDHIVSANDLALVNLAKSETTAVLLPTADVYLKCPFPKARKLLDLGGRVALATDFNPGSSPSQNLNWVGLLARLEMKMSLAEVLCAYSVGAAGALGKIDDGLGSLKEGGPADFCALDVGLEELFFSPGQDCVRSTWSAGKKIG